MSGVGWLPIEMAPRDGTAVLLYRPLAERTQDSVFAVRCTTPNARHCWPATVPPGCDGLNYTEGACYATHFMPLVAPIDAPTPATEVEHE